MREPIRDKSRLEHILQAIAKIEEYTKGMTKQQLLEDSLHLHVQQPIMFRLLVRPSINSQMNISPVIQKLLGE